MAEVKGGLLTNAIALRALPKCDRIRSEFDRPDRTEKALRVEESDDLFDRYDRSPSLAYELNTDDSLQ
jgi:hypothetical protein